MKTLAIFAAAAALAVSARGETVTAEPDAFLEYIEATGSQYIDTDVNAETGLKAYVDFAWADFSDNPDWSLLDASTFSGDANKRSRIFMCHMTNGKPFFGYGKTRRNPAGAVSFVGGQRCTIVTDMSSTNSLELIQDGVKTFDDDDRETFATNENENVNLNLNLFVFATNYGRMPEWYGRGKLYEMKIFKKNATTGEFDLLRHYIPCIKDNRAGLYDTVNGTISFSLGSADFIAGSVTNTVTTSYVEADGTLHENVEAIPLDNTMTTLDAGWYVVNSNVTVNSRINLTGNTNLILGDGCTLDVKGIYIPQGKTLTIYAQSDGVTAGKIVSKPTSGAGIGGISGNDNGNIVICGGIIEATGGENCAAIGGGDGGSGGNITINGGDITANGPTDSDTYENGAGIGGGDGGSGGTIIINGGTITTYSRDGAGIGGGDDGSGGTITINGGTITSYHVNQGQGARIGGGCDGAPGTITINGGTITTEGGSGAGIGGGKGNPAGGTVTINGGIINASGSYGIGAGEGGADVAITLGWMKATDQIYASSYNGTISIADGQAFINDASTPEIVSGTDIDKALVDGKTLIPVPLSGICGKNDAQTDEDESQNVTWLYDISTHTLTISGTGAMAYFISDDQPWAAYQASIATVVIEDGVTSIGEGAFKNCTSLTSIEIPASVTSIEGAFMYCTSLKNITIPASVTSIYNQAFVFCSSLESISVASGNSVYHSKGNCMIETNSHKLILGCKNSVIPDDVTSIGTLAFAGCTGLTSITIPAGVTSIGDEAFSCCTGLTSINIPAGVTTIANNIFYRCTSLESITIPASVTSIGDGAFEDCEDLATVTLLPATPPTLGYETLSGIGSEVSGDKKFYFHGTAYGNDTYSDWNAMYNGNFSGYTSTVIYGATLGSGVTTSPAAICSEGTTKYYTAGTTVTLGHEDAPTGYDINGYTVTDANDDEVSVTEDNGVYSFTMPDGDVTVTAEWEIISFVIDGITYEWTSETTVKVAGYNGTSSPLFIPASVLHNGETYNVTEIGVEAFMGNTSLMEIDMSTNDCPITVIHARAFKDCTNLSSILLPTSLAIIEDEAFSGCDLEEITIPASVNDLGNYVFENCNGNLIIYVPEDKVDTYRSLWPDANIQAVGTIPYIDADGSQAYCKYGEYTVLTGSTSTVTLGSDGETTWYVVNSDVDYKQIELVGDVHLILCDGKTMTAYGGSASAIIGDYRYSNSLTIYGQTAGTGTLQATCGEGNGIQSNAITINGGTVNAEGGDYFDISAGGNVIINGGNVSATGNSGGIMARGNIILGWTNSSDRITASSFSADGTISIADGKVFTDGSGNYFYGTIADVSTLADKTLTPVTNAIPYIDANGTTAYCTNYTEINTSNMPTTLSAGWYVVNGTVNYTDQITLNGDVNLILADGSTMNINHDGSTCIDDEYWGGYYSLTIYGQTGQTGTLSAFSSGYDNPTVKLKNYIQHGGKVTINSGGIALCLINGDFTLTHGTLNVTGSSYHKAIELDNGHAVTVSGGTLNATGGYAIKGNLNMTGGTVNATGSSYGIITGTVTIAEQMIDCTAGTKRAITESIDGNQATALQTFFGNASVSASFKRTFTENVASTICLPFPMTSIPSGKVYQFVGVEYDDTEGWMATMEDETPDNNDVTSTEANKPYLFMPSTTGAVPFTGTINTASMTAGTTSSTDNDWTFYGTYSRLAYGTAPFDDPVFGFAAYATEAGANNNASQEAVEAGEFVKAISGAYIPAFRAFLKYAGSEESLQARGTRSRKTVVPEYITVRLIGKNGDVDAIGEINLSTGDVTFDSNAWYDLNGRKLAEKPTQKGIYINKGKKVALH